MRKIYQRVLTKLDVKVYSILEKIGIVLGVILIFYVGKGFYFKDYVTVKVGIFLAMGPLLLIWGGYKAEEKDCYMLSETGINTSSRNYCITKKTIYYRDIKGIYISNAHLPYMGGILSPLYAEIIKNNEKKIVQTIWISLFKVEEVRFRDIPEASYHVKGLTSEEELYGFKYEKEVFEELLKNCDAHFYFTGNAVWEFTEEIGELFKKYGVTKERIHQLSKNQVIHCKW